MLLFACVYVRMCVLQVKNWITFNEPPMVCEGYNAVSEAPVMLLQRRLHTPSMLMAASSELTL